MKISVYSKLRAFKTKYPFTISWRLMSHAKVINKHLTDGEKVLYAFAAQKNDRWYDVITTYAVVLTDKRIIIGTKRLVFGYFLISITPDMFNDITVSSGLLWGKVYIDTIKEFITLSNIQKSALPKKKKIISEYMMEEKKKFIQRENSK